MTWLFELHQTQPVAHAIGVLAFVCVMGMALGSVKVRGIVLGTSVVIRYFDPSYQIRSRPANSEDALLCDLFARHAVHAAMAGKTGLVIGFLHERFIHVPIELLSTHTKRLDPVTGWWRSVLAATGQPAQFD